MSSDIRRRGIWWDDGRFCFFSGDFSREEAAGGFEILPSMARRLSLGEAVCVPMILEDTQGQISMMYFFRHVDRIYVYLRKAREKSAA